MNRSARPSAVRTVKGALRNARATTGEALANPPAADGSEVYGVPVQYPMRGIWPTGAGATQAIAGDFSQGVLGVRQDITFKILDQAVIMDNSATPVVMHSWLKPGTHVIGMGANAANRREIDPEIVLRASLVVTDDIAQAKLEAGEFIELAKAGQFDWGRVKPLHEIVTGPKIPYDDRAITLFKSLGVGLEDVAVATIIHDRAAASGRFKPL